MAYHLQLFEYVKICLDYAFVFLPFKGYKHI